MTEQTPLGREIERRVRALKKDIKPFSKEIGLNESGLRDIITGRSQSPRGVTLAKIAKGLGCTVSDLMRSAGLASDEDAEFEPDKHTDQPPPGQVQIAELDIRAASGPDGSWATVEAPRSRRRAKDPREDSQVVNLWSFPADGFSAMFGAAAERVRLLRVVGDSMEPTLLPGQIVMVDTEDRGPTPPGIFVIWDGMGLVLKRVEGVAYSDPPTVRIMSDNARYASYERQLGEAYIMGRVIGGWMRK